MKVYLYLTAITAVASLAYAAHYPLDLTLVRQWGPWTLMLLGFAGLAFGLRARAAGMALAVEGAYDPASGVAGESENSGR